MEHSLFWEKHGLRIQYSGHVTCGEFAHVIRAFQSDDRYNDLFYVLHDFSPCTGAAYWRSNLEVLAASTRAILSGISALRVAVVATDPQVLAMIRTYVSFGLSLRVVRYFSMADAAEAWLQSNDERSS